VSGRGRSVCSGVPSSRSTLPTEASLARHTESGHVADEGCTRHSISVGLWCHANPHEHGGTPQGLSRSRHVGGGRRAACASLHIVVGECCAPGQGESAQRQRSASAKSRRLLWRQIARWRCRRAIWMLSALLVYCAGQDGVRRSARYPVDRQASCGHGGFAYGGHRVISLAVGLARIRRTQEACLSALPAR